MLQPQLKAMMFVLSVSPTCPQGNYYNPGSESSHPLSQPAALKVHPGFPGGMKRAQRNLQQQGWRWHGAGHSLWRTPALAENRNEEITRDSYGRRPESHGRKTYARRFSLVLLIYTQVFLQELGIVALFKPLLLKKRILKNPFTRHSGGTDDGKPLGGSGEWPELSYVLT